MDLKRVREIVAAVCESRTVTEMSLQEGASRLTVRRVLAAAAPVAPAAPADTPEPAAPTGCSVLSPLVGIFHHRGTAAQGPITVGMAVQEGQTLGAIESMRMLYEVTATGSGTISEVLVEEEQPVEYGQELFRIQPTAQ